MSVISTGLTEVTTTQYMPLGTLHTVQSSGGPQVWIYIKNDSGGDFAVGNIVARKDSQAFYACVKLPVSGSAAGHPMRAVGAVQHVIADGSYGFVLRYGTVDSAADATTECFGWGHVAVAATATGLAFLNCRG